MNSSMLKCSCVFRPKNVYKEISRILHVIAQFEGILVGARFTYYGSSILTEDSQSLEIHDSARYAWKRPSCLLRRLSCCSTVELARAPNMKTYEQIYNATGDLKQLHQIINITSTATMSRSRGKH